jgi:RecA-family ATPase
MSDLIKNSNIPTKFPIMTVKDFMEYKMKPMELILDPILISSSLSIIFSEKGVGKTFFCLEMAYAIASGNNFLQYKTLKPIKVLYIEGETQSQATQARIRSIIKRNNDYIPDNFSIFSPKFFENKDLCFKSDNKLDENEYYKNDYMLDLDNNYDRKLIENKILEEKFDLVFFDNLSSLRMNSDENNAADHNHFLAWIRGLRNKDISIILVAHEGKGYSDRDKKRSVRGSSKISDYLDLSLNLSAEKEPGHVKIRFDKNRHLHPKDAQPFTVFYTESDGFSYVGKYADPKKVEADELAEQIAQLSDSGKKNKEIATILNISESKVSRVLKANREKNGFIDVETLADEYNNNDNHS